MPLRLGKSGFFLTFRRLRYLIGCWRLGRGSEMAIPQDVQAGLAASDAARQRFESLPPSHQREYVQWIEEAKRPATRQRRIESMVERLVSQRAPAAG
jgi:uncharacterized protein YdeI (YjbR/CyaY-like superfamily)